MEYDGIATLIGAMILCAQVSGLKTYGLNECLVLLERVKVSREGASLGKESQDRAEVDRR